MVLSEALGLWLSSIVREGIGFALETRVFKHGPDFTGCYSPSNRASQESNGHRLEMIPRDRKTSQPEALKLLVVSNN